MITLKILSQIPKLILTLLLELVGDLVVFCILGYRVLRDRPLAESLPKAFSWFDNQSLQYGDHPTDFWSVWNWLCIRNPINKFQYDVLGFIWSKNTKIIYYDTKPSINNISDESEPGKWFTMVQIEDKTYWEYFLVKDWFNTKRCFRMRVGWKIGRLESNHPGGYVQWCFTITPFMRVE